MSTFKFYGFFLRGIHSRKYAKFSRRENKKSLAAEYFGAFNKKKLQHFDKSLMTLENLHQTKLSFKVIPFYSMFGSNHEKVLGILVKRSRHLSQFWISPFWSLFLFTYIPNLFIYLFIYLFKYLFIYLFIYSFIHLHYFLHTYFSFSFI